MITPACVLAIGCNRYQYCESLKSCEQDAEQIRALLADSNNGGVDPAKVRLVRSPMVSDVREALEEACNAVGSNGLLVVYVSGHGLLSKQRQVHLAFQDTDPDRVISTSLPLTDIVAQLVQKSISASILILDLCFSGAHAKATSELALRQLYDQDEGLMIGHFILASSRSNEESTANLGGGTYTQILLEQVELVGRERPFEEYLPITALATAALHASIGKTQQRPCWTGVAISEPVALCRNPYWDPSAAKPATALSFHNIPDDSRQVLAPLARAFAHALARVGSGSIWTEEACRAIWDCVSRPVASASTIVARMVASATERVAAHGIEVDLAQLTYLLEAAAVALGACNGLDDADGNLIFFHLEEHAVSEASRLRTWRMERGWLVTEDGPAAVALAPIRYWDRLGHACVLAAAALAIGRGAECDTLLQEIAEVLRACPALWRIEWAGQYPDVAAVLGAIARRDPKLVQEVARKLFDGFMELETAGNMPIPAHTAPKELGEHLASKYSGSQIKSMLAERPVDEGPALVAFILSRVTESKLERDSLVARRSLAASGEDFYLYAPRTFEAQFAATMSNCDVCTWIRSSPESISKMLDYFESSNSPAAGGNCADPIRAVVAAAAAGRYFRNRSCFWVFDGFRNCVFVATNK